MNLKIFNHIKVTFKYFRKFKKMTFFEKLFYVFSEVPFTLLRDLTIPCCNEEKWNKSIFIMNPLICTLFVLITTNSILLIKISYLNKQSLCFYPINK